MLLKADTDVASTISLWLKDIEVRGFVKYFACNEDDEVDTGDEDDNWEPNNCTQESSGNSITTVDTV